MESKRIHKDIRMTWPILTNGEAVSLEGRDLKLILIDPKGNETELPPKIAESKLRRNEIWNHFQIDFGVE